MPRCLSKASKTCRACQDYQYQQNRGMVLEQKTWLISWKSIAEYFSFQSKTAFLFFRLLCRIHNGAWLQHKKPLFGNARLHFISKKRHFVSLAVFEAQKVIDLRANLPLRVSKNMEDMLHISLMSDTPFLKINS